MTTAADGAGLLDAILDDPSDDLPRLAYADWLDEQGQAQRAEFVRVQVAVAAWERQPDRPGVGMLTLGWDLARCREIHALRAFAGDRTACPCVRCLRERERLLAGTLVGDAYELEDFRRGFVWRVRCTLDAWQAHGPAIVRAHPVTRCELTDREPGDAAGRRSWHDGGVPWLGERGVLPSAIFRRLKEADEDTAAVWYESVTAAVDALSAALIAWANLSDEERQPQTKGAALLTLTHEMNETLAQARLAGGLP